jgi:hypothetical protein
MGTGSAESGIQILCNYSIEERYGLFGSGICILQFASLRNWGSWIFSLIKSIKPYQIPPLRQAVGSLVRIVLWAGATLAQKYWDWRVWIVVLFVASRTFAIQAVRVGKQVY